MRTGDQDESRNEGDVLAFEAACTEKPVRIDNEVMKPSGKEIDLRMDGIPQEEMYSDRQYM